MIDWQPIDTAPTGKVVMVYIPKYWVESVKERGGGHWPGSCAGLAFAERYHDGDSIEWLMHDGDPVGDPTLWAEVPPEPEH